MIDPYEALAQADAARHRSSSGPGPSSFFGADCQTSRTFADHPAVNPNVDKLAAIIGTAVHSALEHALAGHGQHEVTVEYAGIKGHTDFLPDDPADLVVDWKTTTIKKIVRIKREGISRAHHAQVSFYARATNRQRIMLVYIPRDGGRRDIHTVTVDRDDALVDEAVARYYAMKAAAARGQLTLPAPPWADLVTAPSICGRYCEFFDATGAAGCPGPPPPAPPGPPADGSPFHRAAPPGVTA